MPRLTLRPVEGRPGSAVPKDEIEVVSLARLAMGGRWRVEAMRSYSRPLLIWFTRGQGRITTQGASRGYGPHNAVFLPAGTMHGFDMLGQVGGSLVFLPRDELFNWPETPVHLRCRSVTIQKELTGLVETMERVASHPDAESGRELYHLSGLLSVWLARRLNQKDAEIDQARKRRASERLVAAFTEMAEKDFRSSKGVAEYAGELGVTATHLSRACRETSGRSALDFLSERRLFEARQMLAETDRPVAEIAKVLGYGSAAYFSRNFRAGTGLSPSEFRKRPSQERRHPGGRG